MSGLDDHKAKLMIMLAGKKKPDDSEPEEESGLGDEGLRAAMGDFLDAVKGEDPDGMAEAFRHAMDVCDEYEGDSEPDSEE